MDASTELNQGSSLQPGANTSSTRDHLFISYAWEDQAFAAWLSLRLTSEGYRVWFDQYKLLGGESWPRDIDVAIKTRTFRVIGLLSKHSIAKPNPLKERTLALNIAKKPGMNGFLIPLNVDGLSSTDLDWLTSDITFIPFAASWARGLEQLLKLLDREKCPKFSGDGRAIAGTTASSTEVVLQQPDVLTSNAHRFVQIPKSVSTFIVEPKLEGGAAADASRDWPFYTISPHRVLAFHPPSDDLATWLHTEAVRSADWQTTSAIEGVASANVAVSLLRRSIETHCRRRGLIWSHDAEAYFFPGPLGRDLPVLLPAGKKTTVQHSGQRTFFRIGQPKVQYRYWIAAKPSVERDLLGHYSLVWRIRFHFTDTNDVPLLAGQRQSRRKHVTRSWFNRHWLVRHLAVMQFLVDDDGQIRVGPAGHQQVILDGAPVSFLASKSIDEQKLEHMEEVGDEVPVDDGLNNERSDGNSD